MRTRISVGLSSSALSMAPSRGGWPGPRSERRRAVPLLAAYQVTNQLLVLAPALQEAAQVPSNRARLSTDRTDSAMAGTPVSRQSATTIPAYPGDLMNVPLFVPKYELYKK